MSGGLKGGTPDIGVLVEPASSAPGSQALLSTETIIAGRPTHLAERAHSYQVGWQAFLAALVGFDQAQPASTSTAWRTSRGELLCPSREQEWLKNEVKARQKAYEYQAAKLIRSASSMPA